MKINIILSALALIICTCSETPTDTDPDPDPDIPPGEQFGVVWEELDGNPLISQPVCPDWYCLGQTDPWVAKGADGEWTAWFSTGGDLGGPVVGRALVDENFGFTINPSDRPVLELGEDVWNKHRETVSARWNPDQENWTMWYLGYETSFFDDPGFGQMNSLDSDGIEWERSEAPIYTPDPDGWDHAFITGPTFMETPEGQWRLYYSGAGTTVGIGVLISDDEGETWEPHPENPVFERDLDSWDQGILEQSVKIVDGDYMMWYSGYEEPLNLDSTPIYVGLARSSDGINWERSEYNPVLGPGEGGSWNDLRVVSPHVIMGVDGALYMFAHGQSVDSVEMLLGEIGVWRSVPE